MIGGHKVGGQGRWSRSGNRSWGQVRGEVKVGVQVGGQGLRRGQGCGVKVRVIIGGHTVWDQGRGSMLRVKVRGVVKVIGRGSMPGRFGSDGRWGEVGNKQSVPLKNSS